MKILCFVSFGIAGQEEVPTTEELTSLFKKYGGCTFEYTEIPKVVNGKSVTPHFGHVTFFTKESAEKALKELQGLELSNGAKLKMVMRPGEAEETLLPLSEETRAESRNLIAGLSTSTSALWYV